MHPSEPQTGYGDSQVDGFACQVPARDWQSHWVWLCILWFQHLGPENEQPVHPVIGRNRIGLDMLAVKN